MRQNMPSVAERDWLATDQALLFFLEHVKARQHISGTQVVKSLAL